MATSTAVKNPGNVVTRHVYSACAAGVAAVLTSPAKAESWASSSLPVIGGRSASEAGRTVWPDSKDPVLQFDQARTELTGTQTGAQEYTTTIRIAVTNLNILNWVTGSLDVTFTFKYIENPPKDRALDHVEVSIASNIVPAAQPFAGIKISSVALPAITLNSMLYEAAGRDFKNFRAKVIDAQRPGNQHLKHVQGESPNGHGHGVIFTALAEPAGSFVYDTPDYGEVSLPGGIGSVYFGEWCTEPYRQIYTLLRVELKEAQDRLKPGPKFSGQIVVDEEENGRTYPP